MPDKKEKDKQLRRLSRAELMELIYTLRKNQDTLEKMNAELKERLDAKELRVEKAGSLAEAALAVNNVFEDAQAAADQYLQELHRYNEEREATAAQAKRQAEEILTKARQEAAAIREEALRARGLQEAKEAEEEPPEAAPASGRQRRAHALRRKRASLEKLRK